MNLSISVIIPVYNGGEKFRQCLASLNTTIYPFQEVIVIVDGATDNSAEIATEWGAKLIKVTQKSGPAKARNLGANVALGDIIFFVDADVTIYPETLDILVKNFQNNHDLTALIGSYDDTPEETNFLSQYKNLFHHYNHQTADEKAHTFWGACGAIKRDIFLKMEGFDQNYERPCIEDIELGYRLKAAGYNIKLDRDLQVKHLKKWGVISLLKTDFSDRALPWSKLILQQNKIINDLNLRWENRLSVVLVYLLLLTLISSLWQLKLLLLTWIISIILIVLNYSVYKFFLEKRGLWFTIAVLPWHWFYYLYSGLAFGISLINHYIHKF